MRGSLKQRLAIHEQNVSAGGDQKRRFVISNGEVVTGSLELKKINDGYTVSLRFKSGASYRRSVGKVQALDRSDALRAGWDLLRNQNLIEKNGWKWLEP